MVLKQHDLLHIIDRVFKVCKMERYVAYARSSSERQNIDTQINMLQSEPYQYARIYSEKEKGYKMGDLHELNKAIKYLYKNRNQYTLNALVITRIDRMGRNIKGLIDLATRLKNNNITLIITKQNIDITTEHGWLSFARECIEAESEHYKIKDRQEAAKITRKNNGNRTGPKTKISAKKYNKLTKDLFNVDIPIEKIWHKYKNKNNEKYSLEYLKHLRRNLLKPKDIGSQ